jgi:hypothetical protein
MDNASVPFESVRALCKAREIDLVLSHPPSPYVLSWRAQFSDYGHFFSIMVQGVEYLDVLGGFTVGDLRLTTDIDAVSAITARWSFLKGLVSGPMLVIRTADADDWPSARPQDLYLVVANFLQFWPGPDWEDVSTASPSPQ